LQVARETENVKRERVFNLKLATWNLKTVLPGEERLKEIRIHGRGGQGAVLAAELLVVAAFEDNKYGQAFPAFGGERRGAAVQAFIRLDTQPIRLRHRVNTPDWLLILDPSLLQMADVTQGLKPDGLVLINSEKPASSLAWSIDTLVYTIPATRIALEVLGQPLVNPAMLGAFSAVTRAVGLEAIQNAFRRRFPGEMGEKNSQAAQRAYDWVQKGARPEKVTPSRRTVSAVVWEESPGLGAPGRPLHFAAVTAPRTALAYPTGTWRYSRPIFDVEKCNGCGFCEMYCPDNCVWVENKKYYPDYTYCKGCGICARECPAGAIHMAAEEG
jgi:pyruvate ferredoxin oxidoreductase gamma subunit